MERRRFLTSLAIGGISLSGASLLGCGSNRKTLGIQLFSVQDTVAKDLEGTLEKLAKIGYTRLEIYGYNGTFFGKTAAEFKAILSRTGMQVDSSHHTTGFAHQQKGTLTDGWEQAVEDLHTIGAKYMACSYLFPDERTEANYGALPELLNKCGATAKKAGIGFAYHNHDFEFEKYGDTLVMDHILNKTDSQYVNIELDLYWISKAGQDPVAYFNQYPGRFPLWHVKDMESGTGDITDVGSGTIDFDRIFAAREKAGLKEWFVEQDVSKGDIFESISKSYKYLQAKNY